MSLTEFLLARITEDEATALAANVDAWTRVITTEHEGLDYAEVQDAGHCYVMETSSLPIAQHAMTWKPARVLAECEAKRRIIATCEEGCECGASGTALDNWWPSNILAALAQPYADHPDFQPEWALA